MDKLRVLHVTDTAGGSDHLWGKENVIVSLMEAQRATGRVAPELATFTPGLLATTMAQAGYPVHLLSERSGRVPVHAMKQLGRLLAVGPAAVVHTHEYKANIAGRVVRALRAPMRKLVATCPGWGDHTPLLDFYFGIDRITAFGSDIVTVTDPAMIGQFPKLLRPRLEYIPNGVKSLPVPTPRERMDARTKFGFPPDATVIGSLGRLNKKKGIADIIAAAERTQEIENIVWVIAGSGALQSAVEACTLPNLRFVGYQSNGSEYLSALDVYLQTSHFEGLSLSLLESMRSGLPSISTKAGATELAVREGREAFLVDAGDIDAIVERAKRFVENPSLKEALGNAARARFDAAFSLEQQNVKFMELYLS